MPMEMAWNNPIQELFIGGKKQQNKETQMHNII